MPACPGGVQGARHRLAVQQPPPPLTWQVTALGQPKLLERVSKSLMAVQHLFRCFDEDLNGVVTRDEFEMVRLTLRPAPLLPRLRSSAPLSRAAGLAAHRFAIWVSSVDREAAAGSRKFCVTDCCG